MDPFTMAGSVATGLVNNAINQYNTHKERQWLERMMHYQNSYNHPAADFIRKRAAGVNPFAGELNTKPAASVSSSGAADTFPLTDPLAALKTFAEIDNINATTNKTETETDKLLKEIAVLDLGLERGIIEKNEYERRVELMFEDWKKRNPYTVERELKESQTSSNEASAAASYSVSEKNTADAHHAYADALYKSALAATEESLREPRVALLRSQKANQDAQAASAYAIAQKTLQEGKKLEIENQQRAFLQAANAFYGIDISLMNPNFGAKLLSNYSNTVSGVISSSTAFKEFKDMLEKYTAADLWRAESTTDSGSANLNLLYGLVSLGGSGSRSRTGDGAKK